jgi:hypothetical protein
LFAKFQGKEILGELGRLLYSLLNAFSSDGYQIKMFNNLTTSSLGKYGRLIHSLENLALTETPPSCTEEWIYLFDKEDKTISKLPWHKKVQVRYDVTSRYWFKKPIIMPYPVHPVHATLDLKRRLEEYRSSKSDMSIFFSGDTKGYTRNRIRYPKAKLPRLEIINTILERMDKEVLQVKDMSVLNRLQNAAPIKKCVIVDTNETWVDERDWLSYLARADFFLSPPGIVMPMCHNVIEAMAVGSIPITNYPEWFTPSLTHMENCIAFDDQDDLINKLKRALAMNEEEISRMRANVLSYYEAYLRPDTFVRRIESSKDKKIIVLILTEANVARCFSKLKKNSILMRGITPGM